MSGEDENVDRDAGGDGSDLDTRPSCSNGRRRPPSKCSNKDNNSAEKRRLVMRVKYINETSEEDATEMEENPDNSKDRVKSKTNCIQPACNTVENTSEQNLAKVPTPKMTKVFTTDSSDINTSDDSCQSDSSNNEAAEKCPICLRSFREQEIGTPAPCEHIFCATCIQAWSKNTPTCPIDRLSFESILVDRSFLNRERVRVIEVLTTKNKNADEEYTDDLSYCAICYEADREDVMLLCDCCNQGYHMDCLSPPISQVPDGLWFCEHCYEDGSVEDRNLHSPNINELFNELDAELGVLVSQVSELRVPRITRTLQNERIRSRVLNDIRQNSRTRRVRKRRRRRRGSARTYVVEYEVNDFDNKFAINTQRRVVRRKRRRRVQTKRNGSGPTSTARARLAEQLGLPPPGSGRDSSNLGSSSALSLFGNTNDLDYFSDDEDEVTYEDVPTGGGGAAVQTRVRLAQYGVGSAIDRKSIFLERQRPRTPPAVMEPVDLLGTIMDLQDRWHTATQRMQDVHINRDGTLALPSSSNTTATTTTATGKVESDKKSTDALPKPTIMEAPMYQRGGHTNFNRGSGNAGGRGNASGGGYNNNRFGNNYSNNNSNHYRNVNSGQNSNAGSGGNGDTGDSAGDFSMNRSHLFSPGLTRVPPPQQNNSPFSMRFNQRNSAQQQNHQQQQQQQRHSLPFSTPRLPNYNFNNSQSRIQPLFQTQQQQQQQSQQHNLSVPDLFGGLPPPTTSQGMEQPLFSGLPPPIQQPTNFPHIISVPPPPTPPSGANFSWGPPTAPPTSVFGPISRAEAKCDDAENNQSECPNYAVYTTFSKDNSKTTKKHETDKEKENEENQEDDEKEEDLVQLDDDDEDGNVDGGGGSSDNLANENIPLPPTEAPAREIDDDAYEPENPTEEDDDEQELEREQEEIADEQANQIVENTNKSDEELEDDRPSKTVALKTADDGDDHGDDDGDDSSDSESDTEKPIENINNNNNNRSPISKENDAAEKTTNRKGVLELYDDSDWEELELEKPKDATTTDTPEAAATIENPVDRSYTPCLDEPIENDIENVSVSVSEAELETATTTAKVANAVPAETNALQTELISDEEIHTRPAQKPRDSHSKTRSRSKSRPKVRENRRSRSARRGSAERFKKVSNRQKERNYRGITDQKQQNRRVGRNERRRSFATRSRSRSRTPKHTQRYRSRTRSRSLRRPAPRRSRSRSPVLQHHRFSRSPRKRSRTRSPNRRARAFRSRSRGLRSRSRSRSIHNKENARHKNSNNNHNRRIEDKSHNNNNNNSSNNNRPKRRELPRYDVRNVISNQNQRFTKDRYGRDASRPRSRSGSRERAFVRGRSFSRPPRSRSRSRTPTPQRPPQRVRRASFSMSPTPTPPPLHYGQPSMARQISLSPLMHYQTPPVGVRYVSPSPMLARINGGRKLPREHSPSPPPPALQHMQRSRTPSLLRLQQVNSFPPRKSRSLSVVAADRLRNKKKKSKERKKKRSEKKTRDSSLMHAKSPNKAEFEVEKALKKKRRHATSNKHWSPNSPRPNPLVNELPAAHEAMGWTPPPRDGERLLMEVRRSLSVESANQLDKHKRQKKKQKTKEKRKEKRRTRRTASNEPPPSKEVFASGNNILVSVSFNKESNTASNALNNSSIPQTTVVTLPAHREDILDKRRRITYDNGKKQRENSTENNNALSMSKKRDKTNRRRTKTDAKPVAIIDLERSPFQVQQDLMDVIVLTDSEDANEKETAKTQRRQSLLSTSAGEEEQPQQQQQQQQQQQKSADKAATETLDENYEQTQTTQANVLSNNLLTGPKTPPEPHVVKFNIQNKKTINARSALQEELSDGMSEDEQPTCREEISNTPLNEQTTNSTKMVATDNVITETVVAQKIGPNTPPESAPCSPDAYDPFEPTKSPSISPSSPTPSNSAQTTLNDIPTENVSTVSVEMSSKNAEQPQQQLVSSTNSGSVQTHVTNTAATQTSLNAADLVLAFINNKSSNPSNDATHIPGVGDDVISNSNNNNNNNKHDVGTDGLQVLSNVLLNSPVGASLLGLGNKMTQLPALGGSVGSSSSGMLTTGAGGQNISTNNNTSSLLDDSFNITDFDSPYSPGSADYEDLFEPPPDSSKHRGGGAAVNAAKRGKADVFDNLFGSSSPPPRHALPNVFSAGSQRKPGNLPVKSKSSRSKGGFYK